MEQKILQAKSKLKVEFVDDWDKQNLEFDVLLRLKIPLRRVETQRTEPHGDEPQGSGTHRDGS